MPLFNKNFTGGEAMKKQQLIKKIFNFEDVKIVKAETKKYQDIPEVKPFFICDTVKVFRCNRYIEDYYNSLRFEETTAKIDEKLETIIEKRGNYVVRAINRKEHYKITNDKFLEITYPLTSVVSKNFLLVIDNKYKIRIPRPKVCVFSYSNFKDIRWKLDLIEKFNRVIKGEEKLQRSWEWFINLVYIDTQQEVFSHERV